MGYVPSIFKYVLNIFKEYFRLHDREGTKSCLVWAKQRVDKHFVSFSICPCQITSLLTCNITAVPVPRLPWATIIFSGFVTYTIIFGASLSVLLVTQQLPRNWAGCNRLTLTLTFIWESVLIWLFRIHKQICKQMWEHWIMEHIFHFQLFWRANIPHNRLLARESIASPDSNILSHKGLV